MNRLLLVRHGENLANLTKEFSYRLVDYSLTARGRLQAEQTANYLSRYPVTQVFSSPLQRAQETAALIAAKTTGRDAETLEDFRELNVGTLEAQPPTAASWRLHDDIIRRWATGDAAARFPEGEDYSELIARVRRGYEAICWGRDGATLVVVAHGGSLGLPLLTLVPALDSELLRVTHHNCAVSELEASFENRALTLRLVRWATTDHLSGEAADFVAGTPNEGELE